MQSDPAYADACLRRARDSDCMHLQRLSAELGSLLVQPEPVSDATT